MVGRRVQESLGLVVVRFHRSVFAFHQTPNRTRSAGFRAHAACSCPDPTSAVGATGIPRGALLLAEFRRVRQAHFSQPGRSLRARRRALLPNSQSARGSLSGSKRSRPGRSTQDSVFLHHQALPSRNLQFLCTNSQESATFLGVCDRRRGQVFRHWLGPNRWPNSSISS